MKKLFLVLVAVAAMAGIVVSQPRHRAEAVSATLYTSKIVPLTIVVTPSPTPVGYLPSTMNSGASFGSVVARADSHNQLAFAPLSMPDVVAQATPQGSVKVNFTVKADPSAQYLHVVPVSTTMQAGYGPNTFTCVYQVFAHFQTYPWYVTDYVQGSNQSGGGANNGFPTYNYPTASLLQWEAETITTSFAAFSNSGTPGQTAFSGPAGSTKTVCFDLSFNVPNNIPAGTYQTAIQYNLFVQL